jgi:hypothetical protein
VGQFPSVERKGKTTPYTSTNTYMFSFLSKEGKLGLRLGPKGVADFIQIHNGRPMLQHGRVMKDFVEVPESLWEDTDLLQKLFQLSLNHTNSLKPKKK